MSTRRGVLGGMFDPVHNGHIEAARCAVSLLDLDCIHLVPCHIPNHRVAAASAASDRLAMLELAVAAESAMIVDPIEVQRKRVSYTVETLTAMGGGTDVSSLVFVLGMDAFNSLPQWHDWQQLFALCHLLVLAPVKLESRRVETTAEMFKARTGKIRIAEDFKYDLSSTRVRTAIQRQEDLSTLLNTNVIEYINQHKLYL
jgi:nicotinate-nucleotide adenylyltransferase